MSHTPEPWVMGGVSSLDEYSIGIWPSDRTQMAGGKIAVVFGQDIDAPNAYLIAAAPELLAALKTLIEGVDTFWMSENPGAVDAADAAIAKAEGR